MARNTTFDACFLAKKPTPYKPSSYKPQQNCTVLDEVLIAEICTPGNIDGYIFIV